MAIDNVSLEVGAEIGEVLAGVPGLGGLIKIGQAVGIVVIVYIVLLIVNSFIRMKHYKHLKNIERNVIEINKKLSKKK